jgi:phosphopantothenoylcysteine decarboxylase/phosphopantothenate--cysteine ligase
LRARPALIYTGNVGFRQNRRVDGPVQGRRILLIIGGGIAAFKSLELIRLLRKAGADVTPVLTRAGAEFVTPLSVASIAGHKVHADLFSLTDEAEMGHIELSRAADLVVVAPATADLMAKMATGRADDLASTLLMATDKAVLVAPAMNVRMWLHPAMQRNLGTLRGDGVAVVGPNDGDMACGEFGPGRMAEPAEILDAAARRLFAAGPLQGRRIIVTSGPTHEPIDPVRYIANRSSGTQGMAIAAALRDLGAEVVLVTGPVALPVPTGVHVAHVQTAAQMMEAVRDALPADAAVFAAAVADWRVAAPSARKLKKDGSGMVPPLQLAQNPDILKCVARLPHDRRPALVIGFAAETENLVENARAKLAAKGCDWIVANDVSGEVMGGAANRVHLVTADAVDDWPDLPKEEVARRLARKISEEFA